MLVRTITELDYGKFSAWCEARDWLELTQECLPATGIIVDEICAGFIFKT